MKTWLAIDTHFLCHRAFHTAKDLSWKGEPSGVVFGFLKSIISLKDEFQTDRIAFCFEHPHLFRRDLYPGYKRKRMTQERTPEEKQAYESLVKQIQKLRKDYLPRIGFRNVFCFEGMESDDILASIAFNLPDDEDTILVTGDADLLQCLRSNVTVYSPQSRKIWTEENFTAKYGIKPKQWAVMKAISGCTSDEVKGIDRVGEITALKYLREELPVATKQYLAITSAEGRSIVRRNRPLVQLPFKGCPTPRLQDDEISEKGWRSVCSELGMKSLAGRVPVATRARR